MAADQEDISRKFSGPETDRFEMVPVSKGIYGLPILDHYRACFQCAVTEKYPAGDHVIIVGRVIACHFNAIWCLANPGKSSILWTSL